MVSKNFYLLENKTGKKKSGNNKNKIILNTRVRLARNLADSKFASISSGQEKNILLKEIKEYVNDMKGFKDYRFFTVKSLGKIQRDLLFKDYMVSPEMANKMQGKGLFIKSGPNRGESSTVMVNQEDHLRVQSVRSGLNIIEAYNEVIKIEKCFERKLSFAFDRNLGYLTASPVNLGTALRVSVIAHLPVLAVSPRVADFVKKLNQVGCLINGYFVGHSEIIGNLFRISNQVTLGKGEEDIVEEMQAICLNIIDDEEVARRKLKENDPLGIKDNIYRSFGLLKYAKILSYEESLELLSIIRLGLDLDIISGIDDFDYFELINKISDSYIISDLEISGRVTDDELDSIRADLIRKKILKEAD
jgi:protein arginine kinase